MKKNNTSWGKVAGWYNNLLEQGEDTYQKTLIKPNLLRILNVKKGEQILDVGCGQGFFARTIAEQGAKVVGIDIAQELILLAKSQPSKNITYLVLSAENMKSLITERFDAAICILALQNIKNLQAATSEISRVLKPGGRGVLLLNHPAFRVPTASAWGYDTALNVQYRRIDKYMSELSLEVDMNQGIKDTKKKNFTYSFHRPLQVYFKSFEKAGLAVTGLEEWVSHKISDSGPRKTAEDKARKEIPLFMAIKILKLSKQH